MFTEFTKSSKIFGKISKANRDKLKNKSLILETDRLILRKMTTKDYKDIKAMLSDEVVMYAWERTFDTKKENMEWIIRQLNRYEKELVGYFLAIDKETDIAVGQIGLMWNDIKGQKSLEVGYILKKEFFGKGYATEGAKACIQYGFELFGISEIFATIRPENKSSIAVAERIGMKQNGAYTKKYDGKKMEHYIYSIKNSVEGENKL